MTNNAPEYPPRKITFAEFLKWEAETHDVLDFKKIYVDMAGDLHAGLVLSELTYWYLPAKGGRTRLRVRKQGRMWIAVRRWEWWDRCRLTPRQADGALGKLLGAGLIDKAVFKFYGEPTTHVALNVEVFLRAWARLVDQPMGNPFSPVRKSSVPEGLDRSPDGEDGITPGESPLTETTTEDTAEKHTRTAADAEGGAAGSALKEKERREQEIQMVAEAFAKYAGLGPIPARGEAKYPDWRKGYQGLLSICYEYRVQPDTLAIVCAMKRAELGFLAGRPGAFLKTAQNAAVALADPEEKDRLLWQARRFYEEEFAALGQAES